MDVNRLPKQLRQSFFDAVASFKNVRFLWKWDGKIPDNMPSNVLTMEWFPQQEILGKVPYVVLAIKKLLTEAIAKQQTLNVRDL